MRLEGCRYCRKRGNRSLLLWNFNAESQDVRFSPSEGSATRLLLRTIIPEFMNSGMMV